jgi:putative hydrolase of the HAD superfamily
MDTAQIVLTHIQVKTWRDNLCNQFDIIAFDADDTLWHNEVIYLKGRDFFTDLLDQYVDRNHAGVTLDQIETGNVHYYGYGIKSFILSMIETATQLADSKLNGNMVAEIIEYSKQMVMTDPVHFPHTRQTLETLGKSYDLMLITKGDLFEQQRKIARSGLDHYFKFVEVVSDKEPQTYINLLQKYSIHPQRFLMIGNSLRSDIFPVVEIGGQAVYIPYDLTWDHEKILPRPLNPSEYHELEDIRQVPGLIEQLCQS